MSAAGARLHWLSAGGAVAAAVVGTPILWQAGWGGGTLLAAFFLSGSLLSYGRPGRRSGPGRTWRQVAANGGIAAGGALLIPWVPITGWALLAGGLAAAQADTWGTEIGRRSRRPPRLLIGGRTVPPGTSGGVTWLGTAAGIAGATVIGLLTWATDAPASVAGWCVVGGLSGTLVDSALGATLQARYRCAGCGSEFEHPTEHCGASTQPDRGLAWIDNDMVNAMATVTGALVTAIGALVAL